MTELLEQPQAKLKKAEIAAIGSMEDCNPSFQLRSCPQRRQAERVAEMSFVPLKAAAFLHTKHWFEAMPRQSQAQASSHISAVVTRKRGLAVLPQALRLIGPEACVLTR